MLLARVAGEGLYLLNYEEEIESFVSDKESAKLEYAVSLLAYFENN